MKRGQPCAGQMVEWLDTEADITHTERVLPDYTWPARMPLDLLRRLIARESADAIREANASYVSSP